MIALRPKLYLLAVPCKYRYIKLIIFYENKIILMKANGANTCMTIKTKCIFIFKSKFNVHFTDKIVE